MQLFDVADVSQPRLTRDGYLAAEALVARTGIQTYRRGELGLDGDPNETIQVYRPPEEVFAADAMATYAYRPVTVDHPDRMVDASNWKEFARGQTGADVLRDKEFVRVPMVLMDQDAIDEWKAGKRELSMGYETNIVMRDGVTPDGEKYDAVQTALRMNHLALVARARGGSQLKLGDSTQPEVNHVDVKLKTIQVDGLQVETTEAGAQAISKLQDGIADVRSQLGEQQKTHSEALAAKDTELAAKDAEIDKLKEAQLNAADIDALVQQRADLIAVAKTVADKDYSGLSPEEIRRTAVVAALGNDAMEGKSVEYVAARFDMLAEDAAKDGVRKVLSNGVNAGDSSTPYDRYVKRIEDAWKGGQQ